MKKTVIRAIMLILFSMMLQLVGQIASGFAGREGSIFNYFTFIGYSCLVLRAFVWILVLKAMPLTVAYPSTGAIYLMILPLSVIFFGENPGWGRYGGSTLIFLGIIVSSLGSIRSGEHKDE